ncbi:MAG TPA: bifunctional phosphopantothenoylcysteine decarboxylase/phosphopantothenate--cysteine ligase CoaBC [Candidatus Acidoferrales bacterium]|nr:bifunctional phosphopantothenoylcysteine decarboxylase/phosphopantothenate--cysteine ligase CoaBC [Candidatus Acidoferrales bacterium]
MKIVLGVSGCIAAYKAAELVRLLQQDGFSVQVVMTAHAQEFVRPLTFAALSGQKVITEMFAREGAPANLESAIEHIAVADSADLLLIAPATANVLGKLAHGLADDFLTTLVLATKAPVVVAPAMNVNMWEHPAVQANLARLRERGVSIVEPDTGYLACGWTGPGRLASNEAILAKVREVLGIRHDLADETVLVTAGPTCEDIDPVRYLTNRSSGRMGYAVAEAALRRGARVILVSGPTTLEPPPVAVLESVRSAEEMRQAVGKHLAEASVVVKTAAVADFRPAVAQEAKIKRGKGARTMELEPTPDLLEEITAAKGKRLVVGFAAETENVVENARAKLRAKKLDLVVANDVTQNGAGFDSETNIVTLLTRDGQEIALPKMSKFAVANRVLDEVVRLKGARG